MCEFCGADGRSVDRLVVVSVPVQQWDYYPHNNVGGAPLLLLGGVLLCSPGTVFFSSRTAKENVHRPASRGLGRRRRRGPSAAYL